VENGGETMILIINLCKEKLHYYEFVRPIEDILNKDGVEFETKHYLKLDEEDLKGAKKIIICGTSILDNEFMKDVKKFSWIKETDKPLLGICGGMEIIGVLFGGNLKKKTEIGFYFDKFERDFLGMNGMQELYHLHDFYIANLAGFEIFTKAEVIQAIKHRQRRIYGVLFHPEVRNKSLITRFVSL
jgi:GMP synthase-like glutamine amidotransferase